MEDEHLVAELLQPFARHRHARRRDTEHRGHDQRLPSPGGASGPVAIPTSAPAALTMIRVRIAFIPAMSTTEYIIVTSTGPKYGLVSPDAAVETISFGTPTGSRCIACVASVVPPVPPSAPIASKPALGVEPQHDLRRSAGHRLDRRAPVARVGERLHVGAGRRCHLLPRHVRLGERLAEDAGVDQQHVDPALADAVAEVRVLLALRVQRPDEQDGRAPLSNT